MWLLCVVGAPGQIFFWGCPSSDRLGSGGLSGRRDRDGLVTATVRPAQKRKVWRTKNASQLALALARTYLLMSAAPGAA